MFAEHSDKNYQNALDGIQRKTLVFGHHTLMTEFVLSANSTLPRHSHPHEQTGYLVSGKMRLSIGNASFLCSPGDSWCIPENVEHGAEIIEDSLAIEVFSPVRTDYLP